MMYWLFREHHWNPSVYAEMLPGARKVVRAFYLKETEERNEAAKKMKELTDRAG